MASEDVSSIVAGIAAARRVVAKVQGAELELASRLVLRSPSPEHDLAAGTGADVADARRTMRRARTVAQITELSDAMEEGRVGVEHVDAVVSAVRAAPLAVRPAVVSAARRVLSGGFAGRPDELGALLRAAAETAEGDDGVARFARQKAANRLSLRWDKADGMLHIRGSLDPERGGEVEAAIAARVRQHAEAGPAEGAPDDPVEQHRYMSALALHALVCDPAEGAGVQRHVVVVRHHEVDGTVTHDWGASSPRPSSNVDDLLGDASTVRIDVDVAHAADGAVSVSVAGRDGPLGPLNHGRARRAATFLQRLVLRVFHPYCAMPGCNRPFDRCDVHHFVLFVVGGLTNLDNLGPFCIACHHWLHKSGYRAVLLPDRTILIIAPDGTTTIRGPPGTTSRVSYRDENSNFYLSCYDGESDNEWR